MVLVRMGVLINKNTRSKWGAYCKEGAKSNHYGTSLFIKTMCQVVVYPRLNKIENSKTVSRKSGRGRLREVVVYERFRYKALTEDIFGVLGRWSPTGGGGTWRFGCIFIRNMFHVNIPCFLE